jgi:Protein of unknown function (DUF2786)
MTDDKKKIAAKIQALIAKAQSTEHEAEADAFMQKAQELLEQHQISMGELLDADDPVIIDENGFEQTDSSPSWYKDLYVAVAMMYGCKPVLAPKMIITPNKYLRRGYAIELTGRQSAITTTQLMFPWIKQQCFEKGRQLVRLNYGYSDPNEEKKQARRVGNALVQRIHRLVAAERQKNQQAPATPGAKNALTTTDRVLQVYQDHYKNLTESRSRGPTVSNSAAREAANSIGLHRQASGSSTLAIGSK